MRAVTRLSKPEGRVGQDWFEKQPDEVKEEMLGKMGLAAYKEGHLDLEDLVGFRSHPTFGTSVARKPLA